MTIDPQMLRSEQYQEIGRLIEKSVDELIGRWSQRAVAEQPNARRAHDRELRDHLPAFLRILAHGLADLTSPDACPHCAAAVEHGQHRWEAGWSLTEVVRDYQILRLVLTDFLEERLGRPLLLREGQAVGLALDEAIAASVSTFVRHRDEYLARVEQERAESLRKQAQALAEADRRKNEFLAMLGHELRNPLAPILTSVQILARLGSAEPAVAQAHQIIDRQARQLARLVDDLLDMTRIAQGKLELRRGPFDLAAAVTQAVQQTAPLFEAQGHQLLVQLPPGALPLEGDQARIVQVLVNLLNNAGKYTDGGGRIELSAAREGDQVVVRVKDNGIGIEAEMLARVFELFTQVDGATHRSQGGLGIGLTLVRRLVELHNGTVSVHSDGPGHGSEFSVRLPAPGIHSEGTEASKKPAS